MVSDAMAISTNAPIKVDISDFTAIEALFNRCTIRTPFRLADAGVSLGGITRYWM
jgi:hypothetical protein